MNLKGLNKYFLGDSSFLILMVLICMGVVLATYVYVDTYIDSGYERGIGALNEVFVVTSLNEGLNSLDSGNTRDFSEATAFGAAYLFARILEGPLVGILDIGGGIMTGVGIGIPALIFQFSLEDTLFSNPFSAALTGAAVGLILGAIVLLVRRLKPKSTIALGTDIMIGAGNATGRWLGPLIVIYATAYNPIAGIGAALGGALFYKFDRPITGGAILGAMLFGGITLMLTA